MLEGEETYRLPLMECPYCTAHPVISGRQRVGFDLTSVFMRPIRAEVCLAVLAVCLALSACGPSAALPAATPKAVPACSLLTKSEAATLIPGTTPGVSDSVNGESVCNYSYTGSLFPLSVEITWAPDTASGFVQAHNGQPSYLVVSGAKSYFQVSHPTDQYTQVSLAALKHGYVLAIGRTYDAGSSSSTAEIQLDLIMQAMLAKI